jgi:hypothetical protein
MGFSHQQQPADRTRTRWIYYPRPGHYVPFLAFFFSLSYLLSRSPPGYLFCCRVFEVLSTIHSHINSQIKVKQVCPLPIPVRTDAPVLEPPRPSERHSLYGHGAGDKREPSMSKKRGPVQEYSFPAIETRKTRRIFLFQVRLIVVIGAMCVYVFCPLILNTQRFG